MKDDITAGFRISLAGMLHEISKITWVCKKVFTI